MKQLGGDETEDPPLTGKVRSLPPPPHLLNIFTLTTKLSDVYSFKHKRWFAEKLLLLKTEDRNVIVDRLATRSPGCLQKVEGEDKLTIEINAIDTHVFWELIDTICRCLPDCHDLINDCEKRNHKDSGSSRSSKKKKKRRLD